MRLPLVCLFVVLFLGRAFAEEPFFQKGDVIALVGGEDMVALSEYGYLETLLNRALPDYHLRFRNLAWEGDSVFGQRRDLNFPSWEEQLEKIGATVVICQFGQMESFGWPAGTKTARSSSRRMRSCWNGSLEVWQAASRVVTPSDAGMAYPVLISNAVARPAATTATVSARMPSQELAKKAGYRLPKSISTMKSHMRRARSIHEPLTFGLHELAYDVAITLGPEEAVTDASAEQPKGPHRTSGDAEAG